MNMWKLALLGIQRKVFVSTMTVLAITLSVASAGILLRLYLLSESRFETMAKGPTVVVGAKAGGIDILLGSLSAEGDFPSFLPYQLFKSLEARQSIAHEDGSVSHSNQIEKIIPFVYFAKNKNSRVVGTNERFFHDKSQGLNGRVFQGLNDIVLGHEFAKKHSLQLGSQFKITPWIFDHQNLSTVEVTVTGILKPLQSKWDYLAFTSLDLAHETFKQYPQLVRPASSWGPNVLHYYLVDMNPRFIPNFQTFINTRTVAQAIDVQKERERLALLTNQTQTLGFTMSGIIIFLSVLVMSSAFVLKFDSMRMQIAILNALGYLKKEIAMLLLSEALILGILGIALGIGLDGLGFPILRSLLEEGLPPPSLVNISLIKSYPVWIASLFCILLSILIPIRRAYRLDAHKTLRV